MRGDAPAQRRQAERVGIAERVACASAACAAAMTPAGAGVDGWPTSRWRTSAPAAARSLAARSTSMTMKGGDLAAPRRSSGRIASTVGVGKARVDARACPSWRIVAQRTRRRLHGRGCASLSRILLRCLLASALALARSRPGPGSISFLRDAEIENIIRAWLTPIFNAAGPRSATRSISISSTTRRSTPSSPAARTSSSTPARCCGARAPTSSSASWRTRPAISPAAIWRAPTRRCSNATIASIIAMVRGRRRRSAGGNGDAGAAAMLGGAGVGAALVPAILGDAGSLGRPGGDELPRPHPSIGARIARILRDPAAGGAALGGARGSLHADPSADRATRRLMCASMCAFALLRRARSARLDRACTGA